eukprot:Nitzschia sp. Nitz4//scaffold62_size106224//10836//12545//NITZ4_004341-RA/size106224-processed-gene-0.45-mRNA-1//-1//CDS//3329555811//1202//frame0
MAPKNEPSEEDPSFEIKVAVIGPVSAGKSTLINALLLGKYCEVSIRRTTAGVNLFRLNGSTSETAVSKKGNARFEREDHILEQISQDNQELRGRTDVVERTFDIDGVELCKCHRNAKVVVVDVPGINEADSSNKYRKYVLENWFDFDLVLLTMDARHGVNSEEQVELLEFVKNNLKTEKNIPVFVLFNKIDELDFKEKKTILDEARSKVSAIFGVPENRNLVEEIATGKMKGLTELKDRNGTYMPIFLPISIRNAYVYRLASEVDVNRFCSLEQDLLEAIGMEQIGLRQWSKLSEEQKFKEAYQAISDPSIYEEGLTSSNFAAFSVLLSFCIGGDTTQLSLIAAQIEAATARLRPTPSLAKIVEGIWKKNKAINPSGKAGFSRKLEKLFWHNFKLLREANMSFEEAPMILDVLRAYYDLMNRTLGQEKAQEVIEEAVSYVDSLMVVEIPRWKQYIGLDRLVRFEQALVMAGDQQFLTYFGGLKMVLEVERQVSIFDLSKTKTAVKTTTTRSKTMDKNTTKHHYNWAVTDGVWSASGVGAASLAKYRPSDTRHHGHIFWLFCQWMDKIKH